jgi:hypothetical protein
MTINVIAAIIIKDILLNNRIIFQETLYARISGCVVIIGSAGYMWYLDSIKNNNNIVYQDNYIKLSDAP